MITQHSKVLAAVCSLCLGGALVLGGCASDRSDDRGNESTGGNGAGDGGAGNSTGGSDSWTPSACTTTSVLTTIQSLIADYECLPKAAGTDVPDFGYFPINDWPHGSFVYSNPAATAATVGTDSPGRESDIAIRLTVDKPAGEWWAGGAAVWMGGADKVCVDAKAFSGISFWAKGNSNLKSVFLALGTADTTKVADGGLCTGETCGSYRARVAGITSDWKQFTVAWSEFAPPDSPSGLGALVPDNLFGALLFDLDTGALGGQGDAADTIDIWIDDIEFAGATSQLPRNCDDIGGGGSGAGGAGNPGAGGAGGTED